mmetsp:Transcript_11865/g.28040  ORF Transcript_11865/g.28040 Transcript_11865/m.28040 type:complete len:205 (-) Transcript_11865:181-795(-)
MHSLWSNKVQKHVVVANIKHVPQRKVCVFPHKAICVPGTLLHQIQHGFINARCESGSTSLHHCLQRSHGRLQGSPSFCVMKEGWRGLRIASSVFRRLRSFLLWSFELVSDISQDGLAHLVIDGQAVTAAALSQHSRNSLAHSILLICQQPWHLLQQLLPKAGRIPGLDGLGCCLQASLLGLPGVGAHRLQCLPLHLIGTKAACR